MRNYLLVLLIAVALGAGLSSSFTFGQPPRPPIAAPVNPAVEAERQRILEGERWRRMYGEFEQWLSVQQVYRPEEVVAITKELRERVSRMSPPELERFLDEMEARLRVLKSPEADDARLWLKQFMAVARNPEQQLGRPRPDVLNMTAAQIRQEIQWLEQHRASRQQAQSAFDQKRSLQSQFARDAQAARQESRQPPDRSAWPANTPAPRTRSPYAPRRDVIRTTPDPRVIIGPWGAPYIMF